MNDHDLKQRQPNDDLTDLRDCLRAARERWKLSLCWAGPVVPKGRPRLARNGRTFTPQATRDAEAAIKGYVQAIMGTQRLERLEPPRTCRVRLSFHKATLRRCDGDNAEKLVLDALIGVVYRDDGQVVDCHWTMALDRTHPRTVIEIEEVAP